MKKGTSGASCFFYGPHSRPEASSLCGRLGATLSYLKAEGFLAERSPAETSTVSSSVRIAIGQFVFLCGACQTFVAIAVFSDAT